MFPGFVFISGIFQNFRRIVVAWQEGRFYPEHGFGFFENIKEYLQGYGKSTRQTG